MLISTPAYGAFIAVAVLLICLGAWLRWRRVKALVAIREQMQRDQMQLEPQPSATTWGNTVMQPAHAHLRPPPHGASPDAKPEEYLPPYSQPSQPIQPGQPSQPGMPGQPPPYVMPDASTHLRAS
ncbi:hypothetical protein H4S07_003499 [Coemansia furcata]|uniref:Uncharacterized protein n=1 Tax=Coemansia furcata TaxID=417177 RepID=A0ACC1LHX2_9FUNG|nr:hypothetical protein H4S07_003499 [Coemansia furcata]